MTANEYTDELGREQFREEYFDKYGNYPEDEDCPGLPDYCPSCRKKRCREE